MGELTGRLLVVDDDENNLNVLSRRLQREGFLVAGAESGSRALDAVARQIFDLIILDIEMPAMDGFEVLVQLRRAHPATQLPVIIATARHDRGDIVKALDLGANDFVTKPLDFPVVLARVRAALSQKLSVDRILSLETDLRHRNAELQEANDRMRLSLQLAGSMQKSLLPTGPIRTPGVNFASLYVPCDELGGDIFNIFPLGENHVGMYLLDVSGHGVPAALLSVTLSRMLSTVPDQASLVEQEGPNGLEPRSPRMVVEELNRRFLMTPTRQQYFTLFYGVLESKRRQLTYVSAGHPPALRISAARPPKFVESCSYAVGWFSDTSFEESVIELEPSERFYLYSDGCPETMNSSSDQFGRERLAEVCSNGKSAALQYTLNNLEQEMNRFRGEMAIKDDVSALALEITAA